MPHISMFSRKRIIIKKIAVAVTAVATASFAVEVIAIINTVVPTPAKAVIAMSPTAKNAVARVEDIKRRVVEIGSNVAKVASVLAIGFQEDRVAKMVAIAKKIKRRVGEIESSVVEVAIVLAIGFQEKDIRVTKMVVIAKDIKVTKMAIAIEEKMMADILRTITGIFAQCFSLTKCQLI